MDEWDYEILMEISGNGGREYWFMKEDTYGELNESTKPPCWIAFDV